MALEEKTPNLMPKKRKIKNEQPTFCGKCGRVTYSANLDYEWWLIGVGKGAYVIRCPQHITEWTLRTSCIGRTMKSYKWMREAKEQDKYDIRSMFIEPFYSVHDI